MRINLQNLCYALAWLCADVPGDDRLLAGSTG
jgi:hypothetical protein